MSRSIDHIRQSAAELVERIKTDPAFKAQVEQDPQTSLTAAGLPEEAIPDFLRETQTGGDVSGYMGCSLTCLATCAVTVGYP